MTLKSVAACMPADVRGPFTFATASRSNVMYHVSVSSMLELSLTRDPNPTSSAEKTGEGARPFSEDFVGQRHPDKRAP
jgi:hypothetical protein